MYSDAVDWLREEYNRRRAKNSHYSLRAFAKTLGMSSGPLSEILAKKRGLSPKMAVRIATQLGLSDAEREEFVSLLPESLHPPGSFHELNEIAFRQICDHQHFSVLSLLDTHGAHSDIHWIASRLGITSTMAQESLDHLLNLGLVREENGKLVPTGGWTTSTDIPSDAIRHFHRQAIQASLHAVDEIEIEFRDITSITVAADPKRLARAKRLIKRFRRQLSDILETGVKTEVYQLNIQLIPLTRKVFRDA